MTRYLLSQRQRIAAGARKNIVSILLLIIVTLLVSWASRGFYDRLGQDNIVTDFVALWSSARLLLTGGNPYCPEHLQILQQSVGWSHPDPLIIYNPPSMLIYILPFTVGNYVVSKFFWLAFILGLTFLGAHWLWALYGGVKEHRYWSLILLATFSPVYFMIVQGQILPLVLIGLVGFLYFQKYQKDLLAGICITLITIKPHVVYLFWIVLFLWLIRERRWHILIGAVLGSFIAVFVPLLFNQYVFFQYWEAMLDQRSAYLWATPTIGTYLRLLWGGEKYWLQYIPMLLGVSWLLFHWHRRRASWNWTQEMPMLLLVSLMTSFYCWVYDYALLIVPMIQSVAIIADNRNNKIPIRLIGFYIFMNCIAFIEYIIYGGTHYFIWYPLFFLMFYATAVKYFHL